MEKVAVLASGGLDSALLIAESAETAEVWPIYVRWGLRWEDAELGALDQFTSALNHPDIRPVTILEMPIGPIYGPDHWGVRGEVPSWDQPEDQLFLPGRNILLLGLAAVWCSTHEVGRVGIGSLGAPPFFPDATPEFFRDFGEVVGTGMNQRIQIEAPFRYRRKQDLIRTHADLPLEFTLTCNSPIGGIHCGCCRKCRERREAFRDAQVADRAPYASTAYFVR